MQKALRVTERIMITALSRCYFYGIKRISFEPPTNQEFAEVEALGQKAVAPLARYLDLEPKNGLTQLFAVKLSPSHRRLVHVRSTKNSLCSRPMGGHPELPLLIYLFAISHAEAKPM